jgi:hypothetical protein
MRIIRRKLFVYARYCEYLSGSIIQFERVLFTGVGDVIFSFEGLPNGELLRSVIRNLPSRVYREQSWLHQAA